MDMILIIMGLIFIVMGYLVGMKKMVWLLAGYNQERVENKNKLANLVGGTFAVLGLGILLSGFFQILETETIITIAVVIIVIEIAYVNMRLVNN